MIAWGRFSHSPAPPSFRIHDGTPIRLMTVYAWLATRSTALPYASSIPAVESPRIPRVRVSTVRL